MFDIQWYWFTMASRGLEGPRKWKSHTKNLYEWFLLHCCQGAIMTHATCRVDETIKNKAVGKQTSLPDKSSSQTTTDEHPPGIHERSRPPATNPSLRSSLWVALRSRSHPPWAAGGVNYPTGTDPQQLWLGLPPMTCVTPSEPTAAGSHIATNSL